MWEWPAWLGQAIYFAGIVAATMTAFYMFRAYFMTFHGAFRGWKIVRRWRAPKGHDEHHEHLLHGARPRGRLEGPVPRESPLAMTVPLMVLAALAGVAGFFYAEPIHVAPLAHVLEPTFAHAHEAVLPISADVQKLMWPMMLPGLAAFLVGTAGAMVIYLNRQGAPERAFAMRMPGLYSLIVDKWRIDELYDATIVGMVDALADIFAMADKWIIDGIIAKVTAAVVGLFGTVLRAFQSGRIQVYSASMMAGLAGLAWYFVRPHAEATVDDKQLKTAGLVVLTAAPGLGYSYRWEGPGVTSGPDFTDKRDLNVPLNPGERKEVVLFVKNAFNGVASEKVNLMRPAARKGPQIIDPSALPQAPKLPDIGPGPIPGDKIPELINPGGGR
jgi:NADH-quinone oxidoreductase subunit L